MAGIAAGFPAPSLVLPEELEFFAEEEIITIVPNFEIDENAGHIQCIGEQYGPFRPSMFVPVPLWMAIQLFKKQRCRIMSPEWMGKENLRSE